MNSDQVRRAWAERSGEYSPAYYAYYGPDGTSATVRELLDHYVDRDAPVLELGCSSGRHLAHLLDHGYERLAGIELNDEAFEVMADTYPDLADRGTFYRAAIEDVVEDFEDDEFAAVFSVETLQHLHPDAAWVYEELARITDELLVTVENEGDDDRPPRNPDGRSGGAGVNYVNDDFPLYYRDWKGIFTDLGLDQVAVREGDRDTLRAFRPV